jgi:hypothetical protein
VHGLGVRTQSKVFGVQATDRRLQLNLGICCSATSQFGPASRSPSAPPAPTWQLGYTRFRPAAGSLMLRHRRPPIQAPHVPAAAAPRAAAHHPLHPALGPSRHLHALRPPSRRGQPAQSQCSVWGGKQRACSGPLNQSLIFSSSPSGPQVPPLPPQVQCNRQGCQWRAKTSLRSSDYSDAPLTPRLGRYIDSSGSSQPQLAQAHIYIQLQNSPGA